MKAIWFVLALFAAGAAAQDTTGTVEGKVTRKDTGEPISGVTVTLAAGMDSPFPAARTIDFTASTDASGRFTIANVPAGRYLLHAERSGYFAATLSPYRNLAAPGSRNQPLPYEMTGVNVTARVRTSLDLQLIPGGTMSGRVLDPSGKPLARMTIEPLQVDYSKGSAELVRIFGNPMVGTSTDDHGEFRMYGFPAGVYYIRAATEVRADEAPGRRDTFAPTYYPSALDADSAVPVTVQAGTESSGLEIRIQAPKVFMVSGRILNILPNAASMPPRYEFYVVPQGSTIGDPLAIVRNSAADASGGKFELRGIRSGSYELVVLFVNPRLRANYTGLALEVADKNVEGLTVTIAPPVELKGSVTIDGAPASNFGVTWNPLGFALFPYATGTTALARTDTNGAFTVANVTPGRYRIGPSVRGSLYLADILQGARSLLDSGVITITAQAPEPVQLIFHTQGGNLEGTVWAPQGEPLSGLSVVLVPAAARRQNFALYNKVGTDATGHFVIRGITPGEYEVFAWTTLALDAEKSRSFIARYEQFGHPVSVAAGASQSIQVQLIPH